MKNETILKSKIPASGSGARLIEFLCGRFRYHSRDEWENIISAGRVTVNGASADKDILLKTNDSVEFRVVLNEPPVDRDIRIIHEEPTFLAAFKPGNLPSHADGNFIKNTFIFILAETLKAAGFTGSAKLVHRLDRETSGIMIVSKTIGSHRMLMKQFHEGSVEKEYIAIVRGIVEHESFSVNGSIVRDADSSISVKRKLVPAEIGDAGYSETRFEVIERLRDSTVVRCLPHSGRTNQIRVHLAHANHPLIGDKLYGRTDEEFLFFVNNVKTQNFEPLPWLETRRQMLHACSLAVCHPVTGERIVFSEPLPADMRDFIDNNRR